MNDLKNTTKIVKAILEEDEQARNSDSFLYLKVLDVYGEKNGIDIKSMSITTFLLHLREFGFPGFETVRRSRQPIPTLLLVARWGPCGRSTNRNSEPTQKG